MDNGAKFFQFRPVAKDDPTHCSAIQRTIGLKHLLSEDAHDVSPGWSSRFHSLAG
jgi:hypothetical protein